MDTRPKITTHEQELYTPLLNPTIFNKWNIILANANPHYCNFALGNYSAKTPSGDPKLPK
jgi:hypothetical protein